MTHIASLMRNIQPHKRIGKFTFANLYSHIMEIKQNMMINTKRDLAVLVSNGAVMFL